MSGDGGEREVGERGDRDAGQAFDVRSDRRIVNDGGRRDGGELRDDDTGDGRADDGQRNENIEVSDSNDEIADAIPVVLVGRARLQWLIERDGEHVGGE